jgi:hypothetical protein
MNTRCFAFEPEDNQPDDERNVIMIPNQASNLLFYIGTMINDFASSFLKSFGGLSEIVDKKSVIQSPMQADLIASFNSTEEATKAKKRTPGRALKLIGDLNLLGGNLKAAADYYLNAIEVCKLNMDYLWHASAIEGSLITHYLRIVRNVI